jgi:hypothetical protein
VDSQHVNLGPPDHIAKATAWEDVGITGDGWTHGHPHGRHVRPSSGIDHDPGSSHRHEHQWYPVEDHHHPIPDDDLADPHDPALD